MLSKASEYAIRSLVYIALRNREGSRPGYREIAREVKSPVQFTAKILQALVRQKLLTSVKGRGGGFFIENIETGMPLLKVIQVMEGENIFTRCGIGLNYCSDTNPCPIHNRYAMIRDQCQHLFENCTIQDLASEITSGETFLSRG